MDIATSSQELADQIADLATQISAADPLESIGDLPERLVTATESVEPWQAGAVLRALASHLIRTEDKLRDARESVLSLESAP